MTNQEWKEMIEYFDQRRIELGLSHLDITEKLGLNHWELDDFWEGYTDVNLSDVFHLANALGIKLKMEFVDK